MLTIIITFVIFFMANGALNAIADLTGIDQIATLSWWWVLLASFIAAVFIDKLAGGLMNLLGATRAGISGGGDGLGRLLGSLISLIIGAVLLALNLLVADHFIGGALDSFLSNIQYMLLAAMFGSLFFVPKQMRGPQFLIAIVIGGIFFSSFMSFRMNDGVGGDMEMLSDGRIIYSTYDMPTLMAGEEYRITVTGDAELDYQILGKGLSWSPLIKNWQGKVKPAGDVRNIGDWMGYGEPRPIGQVMIAIGGVIVQTPYAFDSDGNMNVLITAPRSGRLSFVINIPTPASGNYSGYDRRYQWGCEKKSTATSSGLARDYERTRNQVLNRVLPNFSSGLQFDDFHEFEYTGKSRERQVVRDELGNQLKLNPNQEFAVIVMGGTVPEHMILTIRDAGRPDNPEVRLNIKEGMFNKGVPIKIDRLNISRTNEHSGNLGFYIVDDAQFADLQANIRILIKK